jgi:hypothetical protein
MMMQKTRGSISSPKAIDPVRLVRNTATPAAAIIKEEVAGRLLRKNIATASATTAPILSASGTTIEARSLLFDPDWYRTEYPDVAAAGADPIRHFFDDGAREGRNPNPYFMTSWYVTTYQDVAVSAMNPFLHYLLYGAREGRQWRP